MPFAPNPEYQRVYRMVQRVAENLEVQVQRVDEDAFTGSIISHIRTSIASADVFLALVTEENGNVYYEIGLAHCQQKPVILLTSDPSSLKFDLQDHRAVVYNADNPGNAESELSRVLSAALRGPTDPKSYLDSLFSGRARSNKPASHYGLDKLKRDLAKECSLREPVEVTQMSVSDQDRSLSLEVKDFMGTRVRAVFDVNGIMQQFRRM